MKLKHIFAAITLLLTACGPTPEQIAQERLRAAKTNSVILRNMPGVLRQCVRLIEGKPLSASAMAASGAEPHEGLLSNYAMTVMENDKSIFGTGPRKMYMAVRPPLLPYSPVCTFDLSERPSTLFTFAATFMQTLKDDGFTAEMTGRGLYLATKGNLKVGMSITTTIRDGIRSTKARISRAR